MVLVNPFAWEQWRHRHREQGYGHRWAGRKERMGQVERIAWKYIHYYMENRYPMGICSMTQGALTGALEQPRGVAKDGRWVGDLRGRGDIYIHTYIHVDS